MCGLTLCRIAYEACGTWVYRVIGTYDSEFDTLALTETVLRAGESLGSTFSYAVGATDSASLMDNLIVAAVVWFAAVPATTYCAWSIRDQPGQAASEPCSAVRDEHILKALDADAKQAGFNENMV